MPEPEMTTAERKAHDEALKRIGDCLRRRGTALDLSRLKLTRLPSKITQLSKLTVLDLSHNLLADLPAELGQLAHLTRLVLSNNPLGALPPAIGQLADLTDLDLSHASLATVPPELSRLTRLSRLDLSHNALHAVPPELGQLAGLTRLYLSNNPLESLPPELGRLANLTRLYLSHNHLRGVPPELGQLAALTRLDLSNNLLESLPPELGRLARLTVLDLSHNRLATVPPELGQLAKLTVLDLTANRLAALPENLAALEVLDRLLLHDNPALQLSPSIIGDDPRTVPQPQTASARSILDFYFARQAGRTRPLNEMKLILLGRSGSGKTSIVQALRDLPFREREASTPGVTLCDCTLDGSGGQAVTAHVWDCSGQEPTHALHPVFFSTRSIFVVVLTAAGGHPGDDAAYWLRMIREFGTDARGQLPPVIVALNQWNVPGARPEVDRAALRESYPFIRGFVEMDCKAKKGVPALKAALLREADRLPWVREPIPEQWDAVRRALTTGTTALTCLTEAQYRVHCADDGVKDAGQQDYLAEILHQLGVVLNFRDDPRLREAGVLAPEWLTRNAYALLQRAANRAGLLRQADVAAVLDVGNARDAGLYPIKFLEHCGIAHALQTADGGAWLVPRLLPADPPSALGDFRAVEDAACLRFTYQELPDGLLVRLAARRFDFIEEAREQKRLWSRGLVFLRHGARALIRIEPQDRQVTLTVTGPANARDHLASLCHTELRDLHASLPGTTPVEESLIDSIWVRADIPAEADTQL